MTGPWQITDNQEASRLEAKIDGQLAELVYRRRPGRLVIIHTGVPPEFEGHGIAGALVTAAVDRAARENLTVVPLCPFARRWLARHPAVAAAVRVDWGPAGPADPAPEQPGGPALEQPGDLPSGQPGDPAAGQPGGPPSGQPGGPPSGQPGGPAPGASRQPLDRTRRTRR
jgi:uncharacterized protein